MSDEYTEQLERAVRLALLHLDNPPDLIFSQRNRTAVIDQLRRVLKGEHVLEEYHLARRLIRKDQP